MHLQHRPLDLNFLWSRVYVTLHRLQANLKFLPCRFQWNSIKPNISCGLNLNLSLEKYVQMLKAWFLFVPQNEGYQSLYVSYHNLSDHKQISLLRLILITVIACYDCFDHIKGCKVISLVLSGIFIKHFIISKWLEISFWFLDVNLISFQIALDNILALHIQLFVNKRSDSNDNFDTFFIYFLHFI